MSVKVSEFTSISIVYSTVCSGADKKNPPAIGWFPSQKASNAEKVSILVTSSCGVSSELQWNNAYRGYK